MDRVTAYSSPHFSTGAARRGRKGVRRQGARPKGPRKETSARRAGHRSGTRARGPLVFSPSVQRSSQMASRPDGRSSLAPV